jgi:hypothetical protein
MQYIYNVYSGECYSILEYELKNVQEGEIPIRQKPKTSCKKCYGRGYIGRDSTKHIFQPCPNCIEKQIIDGGEKYLFFNYIAFKNK